MRVRYHLYVSINASRVRGFEGCLFPVNDVAFHLTRFGIELEECTLAGTVYTESEVDFRLRVGGENCRHLEVESLWPWSVARRDLDNARAGTIRRAATWRHLRAFR